MLTLDTSGILAALDVRDPHHGQALAELERTRGPFVVPAGIMAEVMYMIESRLGPGLADAFLADLEEGAFTLDCTEGDLPRVRALMQRYHDLPLGYADATVLACAVRRGGKVLTFALRHFSLVAREGTIMLVGVERD